MLNWAEIETVLLDMDGTLLDLHFDNHFWREHLIQRYAEQHRLPIEQVKPKLLELMARTRGSLDWYCLDFWSRELRLDIVALKYEVADLISIHPHAEEFLQALQGWRPLALVTNAHPNALQLKLERTGIAVYFDHIVSAHQYDMPKEALKFWERLQQELGFRPERTLLVEDNVSILKTAQQYGIAHLLAVKQPDSHAEPLAVKDFPAVAHFGELLPIAK